MIKQIRPLLSIILFSLLCTINAFAQPPVITSFSPASGPIGTLVTISGTHLHAPSTFTIGGATAIVISNTGTSLVGLVMPGALTGSISITTAGGSVTSTGNFTITPSLSPNIQQGLKLVGSGSVGQSFQGVTVALSADGNTVAVGAYNDNAPAGAIWVYVRQGGSWVQQGSKLVTSGGGQASLGTSIAISADGSSIISGATSDSSGEGAAFVFTRSAGVWTEQAKLVGAGGTSGQGQSVAISADGNTAFVTSQVDDSKGAAWAFTRAGGVWTQQGPKIVPTDLIGNARFGTSAALSADGNTVIFGGPDDNGSQGAAWIWTRSGGIWTQQGGKLISSGGTAAGRSVAISANGNTAAVGSWSDAAEKGAVWIWQRVGGNWTQDGAKLTENIDERSQFGYSISMSGDGNMFLAGGPFANGAWMFTRQSGIWSQKGNKLLAGNMVGNAEVGAAASLSADGNTAVLGGFRDNGQVGAIWAFTNTPNPEVVSFSPAIATTGTTVTITGNNFNDVTGVKFGGTSATSFAVTSATSMTAVVGSGTTGSVEVTTYYGSSLKAGFTYLSSNADLSGLQTSGFALSSTFQANVISYASTVANNVSAVFLTPTVAQSSAIVKINGQIVANMTASGNLALSVGSNIITLQVTAENTTSVRTYTINITRLPSANADLSGLTISTGTLTPTFSAATETYATAVSNATSSITITPTISEPTATLKVNGATVVSGFASATIPLVVGDNNITTVVTAGNGSTTKTYTINVIRAPSNNANLATLTISAGTLSPSFVPNISAYTSNVNNETTSITVTPTTAGGGATLSVNGIAVASGSASGVIPLIIGNNSIVVVVTAEDGLTTRTYNLNITRAIPNDLVFAQSDLDALVADAIKGSNNDLNAVIDPLLLPASGLSGSVISWSSSNTYTLSNTGTVMTRPIFGTGPAVITLTATVTRGSAILTKVFTVTVPQLPNQAPTMNAVATQTLCYTTTQQTIALSGITGGPESGQILSIIATSSNSTLLSGLTVTQPQNGLASLRFTPVNSAGGTVTVTVTITDDGGVANGGVNSLTRMFTITVNSLPIVSVTSNLGTEISKGATVILTVSGGSTYSWANNSGIISGQNSTSLTVRPTVTTTYTVTGTSSAGCATQQTFTLTVKEDYELVAGTNILTPNGDGKNDVLFFSNLDVYPNNVLQIFDVGGRKVYEKRKYTNDWSGTLNGSLLANGTYYYMMDFGSGQRRIKGFVSILRR